MASNMTYAQALNDAKAVIVRQSNRLKADAEKIASQNQEIAEQRATIALMTKELQRFSELESQLAEMTTGRQHAEAVVGRQKVQIDMLEDAARDLQRIVQDQGEQITSLSAELESARQQLPTMDDVSALEEMAALLQSKKLPKKTIHAEVSQAAPVQAEAAPAADSPFRINAEKIAA